MIHTLLGYNVDPNAYLTEKKHFYSCANFPPTTKFSLYNQDVKISFEPFILKAMDEINNEDLFNLTWDPEQQIQSNKFANILCLTNNISHPGDTMRYSYGSTYPSNSHVTFSTELILYPNVMYTVILHELLHALGLDHSTIKGIMAWIVFRRIDNSIRELDQPLWLSKDDHDGLLYMYQNRLIH